MVSNSIRSKAESGQAEHFDPGTEVCELMKKVAAVSLQLRIPAVAAVKVEERQL
jgi:hypothetical protein